MSYDQNPGSGASTSGKLDPIEMNKMIAYYANNIAPVLTKLKNENFPDIDPNIKDATSAWLSFAEIEKFIADNKASGKANGVRIYYGVHVSDSFPGDPTKNQKGLHNIILVPTSSDSQPPTYLNSQNLVEVKASGGGASEGPKEDDPNYALDNVPLCPPNCPPPPPPPPTR